MHHSNYLFGSSEPGRLQGSFVLSPVHMDKERALPAQGLLRAGPVGHEDKVLNKHCCRHTDVVGSTEDLEVYSA